MRLTCPACGAVASLEAWLLDEEARRALAVILALPGDVAQLTPRYLGLFRSPESKRGLAWGKVNRLATELTELVKEEEITWKHRSARKVAPGMWAEGIRMMLDQAETKKLELPLESHNYLRAVVHGLADKVDAREETQRELGRRSSTRAPEPPAEAEKIDMGEGAIRAREILENLRRDKAVGGDNEQP